MLYLLAVVVPPLAVLLSGKPFQALFSLIAQLTLIGWLPATLHALFVVNGHYADRRQQRLIKAMERSSQ
ncbi:MAG: YqaE/Pmp3 family membrane protein [Chloroflexota bacterium]|nr:YqaE/Pmp3 family membrane protein [Chloroflexota bacterium]